MTAYVLSVGHKNGKVDIYGPFPSIKRAEAYAVAVENIHLCRWFVKELIVPFAVVKNIMWRQQ